MIITKAGQRASTRYALNVGFEGFIRRWLINYGSRMHVDLHSFLNKLGDDMKCYSRRITVARTQSTTYMIRSWLASTTTAVVFVNT